MRAGELDRKIIIEQQASGQDSIGEPNGSWSTFATVWASVKPVRANEIYSAQQVSPDRETRFRIRYLSGVTEKMRISYDSKYWDIRGIEEIGRRQGLDLIAVARR